MNKKIESLLLEAEFYRNSRIYDKALLSLHKLIQECPKNVNYKYLLAATYLEATNIEAAKDYAEQILKENPKHKESLELLGIIAIEEKNYSKAKMYLKEALAIDPDFHSARQNLIELYDKYLPDDNKLEKHCKYMLTHREPDRYKLPVKKLKEIQFNWLIYVNYTLVRALARQHKFEEAIRYVREDISGYKAIQRKYNPIDNINQYGDIYQFYYLMGDKKKLEEFKQEYKNIYYGMPEDEIEQNFRYFEKWAIERYS